MENLLYTKLANSLIDQVQSGTYRVGEKMPSVRTLAKRSQVSISTVNAAYAILEERGWVEARHKSGYFVKRNKMPEIAKPTAVVMKPKPKAVTTTELALQVQREASSDLDQNFSCAIPDLDLPINNVVQKAMTRQSRLGSHINEGYGDTEGVYELRQQIARRAVDANVHTSPDAIITTQGAQNAIYLALKATAKPGDIVAVESPCYFGLLQMIDALGLKAIEIPADTETGISVDALKLALNQWPINIILSISSFSNPQSCSVPDEQKKAILELAVQHDMVIVEDDIYGELNFSGRRPSTFKSYDPDGRVLLCSSVSKTMAPHLRVGWIIPGKFYDQVLHQKYACYLSSPTLPQYVTAEVMSKGLYDRHLRQARTLYQQRCATMHDLALRYFPEQTRASSPQGGLFMWFEMPDQINTTELYYRCREQHIRIAPGELFSISGFYRNCFRLNYANSWSTPRETAIKQIGHCIKEML